MTPNTEQKAKGRKPKATTEEPIEKQHWKTADKHFKNAAASRKVQTKQYRSFLHH